VGRLDGGSKKICPLVRMYANILFKVYEWISFATKVPFLSDFTCRNGTLGASSNFKCKAE